MKRKSQKTLEISSRLYKIDIATLKESVEKRMQMWVLNSSIIYYIIFERKIFLRAMNGCLG